MSLYRTFYFPTSRNEPVEAKPLNPLSDNAMALETGNVGADGYSVLSRANRVTGDRPIAGHPCDEPPRIQEDY